MSRRLLQVTNGFLALLTIGLGGMSLLRGVNSPIYTGTDLPALPVLDSNLRFMGGLGMGLGVALLCIIPSIERQSKVFRIVWFCALMGGIGRLVSVALVGWPPLPLVLFAALEVPGVPLLIIWQYRVEASHSGSN